MITLLAICTRERPASLGRCLQSVAQFAVPANIDFRIVVIDNAARPEARAQTQKVITAIPNLEHAILVHETRTGIPFARNRALDLAVEQEADVLLFLDDDQTAPPDWLASMLRVYEEEQVEVVRCKVVWEFEGKGRYREFFDRKDRSLVTPRTHTIRKSQTCGVLIARKLFADWALRFDESIGLGGGSDRIFFMEAFHLGAKQVITTETQATEFCPADKQSLRWLFKRKFRAGAMSLRTRPQPKRQLIVSGTKSLVANILFSIMTVYAPRKALAYAIKAAWWAGMIWGSLGLNVNEYKSVIGR